MSSSILQCDVVCCSVLHCDAARCSVLPCVAVRCSALQCADSVCLQYVDILQTTASDSAHAVCTAVCGSVWCIVLQCVAL